LETILPPGYPGYLAGFIAGGIVVGIAGMIMKPEKNREDPDYDTV
jgi:gas vesicle protein